MSVVNN